VPVLDRERTRTRTGRIWTYIGDRNHPYIVYDYTGNRRHEGPEEFLRDYIGYLQADAYRGYDTVFNKRRQYLTEVACWAHSRRRYFEARSSDLCRSMVMLAYIQLLYDLNSGAKILTTSILSS
jgi:transposase